MNRAAELFGTMVFNESVMKERLPEDVFDKVLLAMNNGTNPMPGPAPVAARSMWFMAEEF